MAGAKMAMPAATARDPGRTRERILAAALKEFAGKGFAGARVDAIAHRAAINKRMLYHYFGDKEGLFREVLHRKMAEREAWGEATPDDPSQSLPFWLDLMCKDTDWIRLLEWEALQGGEKGIIDVERRCEAATRAVARIRARQARGQVSAEFDPRHVLLAMLALTMYPVAFPQLARLILGRSVRDSRLQKEYREFLRQMAVAFRPKARQSR